MPISSNHPTFGAITILEAYHHTARNYSQLVPVEEDLLPDTAGLKVLLTEQDKALGEGLPVTQTPDGDEIFLRYAEYPKKNRKMAFAHVEEWNPLVKFYKRYILQMSNPTRSKDLSEAPLKKLVSSLQQPTTQQTPEVNFHTKQIALAYFERFLNS